jgi:indolepyruvate ferredoxin oxidoreductase, alpha subunit
MKVLLSGNEAFARGAFEAGVSVAAAYPGTPSTEILENIVQYKEIYAEWAPNEKVALEVALGAAIAGGRALACMKHVGVNVAADPLFTASYTGVGAGLVIITADDPEMHSSQNEQDNRNYAKFAKIPMLEPADSQEAKDFVKLAFELSERFDTPVFIRSTTRISHAKSLVEQGKPEKRETPTDIRRNFEKFVMLPRNARMRHPIVEQRIKDLAAFADGFDANEIILQSTDIGIISSGTAYQYARESYPEKSFLKLSMAYPLPEKKIREFASRVDTLYVFEELDPFYEDQIKAMGISVTGKDVFPICGEFNPATAAIGISGAKPAAAAPLLEHLPPRPPNMCPGCPHRGIFYILKTMKLFVSGDIGCYTLGALPPLGAMHSCICMGASVSGAMGMDKALRDNNLGKAVAVIGDSTFVHSGITGLLDIAYNQGACTVIILDNRITAMTGRQEHPGTGFTLMGKPAKQLDYAVLCSALGIEHVRTVNPYDLDQVKNVIEEEVNRPEASVILAQAPCVLHRREFKGLGPAFRVDTEACIGCKACLQIGCPAISWHPDEGAKGAAYINELCVGCTICARICKKSAIKAGK